jgi:hypothetical protein
MGNKKREEESARGLWLSDAHDGNRQERKERERA